MFKLETASEQKTILPQSTLSNNVGTKDGNKRKIKTEIKGKFLKRLTIGMTLCHSVLKLEKRRHRFQ